MAAPKGNQYAKGNPNSGRPPKYDLEKEAKELLAFSKRESCLCLEDFTDDKDYCAGDLSEFAKRSEVFKEALKKAKERIGKRREQFVSLDKLNYGVWNRSARLYSTILKDDEEDVKERDLERKIKLVEYELHRKSQMEQNKGIPPNDANLNVLIEEIKTLKEKMNAS